MLDAAQLGAALRDLAEYGFVIVDCREAAEQVRRAAPVATRIEARVHWNSAGWVVRTTGQVLLGR